MDQPHPHIAEVLEHWRRLAPAPGLLPGRRHFDPLAVPHLLPNIWLLDVEPGAHRRYRVRLIGGAILSVGFPARQGEYLDDPKVTSDVSGMRAVLETVVETGEPDWRRGPPVIDHTQYVDTLERVILPFASDGSSVDLLMGCTVFYWKSGHVRK